MFKKTNIPFQTGNSINGFETGTSPQIGYRIDRHGNIRLPRIGEINVLGYTTKEVRLKLEEELLKYLTDKDANPEQLIAKGYGEKNPIAANDTDENKAKNRRVELSILDENVKTE